MSLVFLAFMSMPRCSPAHNSTYASPARNARKTQETKHTPRQSKPAPPSGHGAPPDAILDLVSIILLTRVFNSQVASPDPRLKQSQAPQIPSSKLQTRRWPGVHRQLGPSRTQVNWFNFNSQLQPHPSSQPQPLPQVTALATQPWQFILTLHLSISLLALRGHLTLRIRGCFVALYPPRPCSKTCPRSDTEPPICDTKTPVTPPCHSS